LRSRFLFSGLGYGVLKLPKRKLYFISIEFELLKLLPWDISGFYRIDVM